MRSAGGGGGGGLVSARPDAMRRFVGHAGSRVNGLTAAAAKLGPALDQLRAGMRDPAFTVRLPGVDLDGEINRLVARWTITDAMVEQVAAAFERADVLRTGGLAMAYPSELDKRLKAANYNPLAALVKGGRGAPPSLLRCFPDGSSYAGGGYVRGPDGRLWPLVVPQLRGKDGPYHEFDDGKNDAGTLGGQDPGWVVVGDYRGIGPLESTSGGEKAAAAVVALIGGKPPGHAADKEDLKGLRYGIGSGRPYWVEGGEPPQATPKGIADPSPEIKPYAPVSEGGGQRPIPPTRGTAGATALSGAVNALHAIDKISDEHAGAYHLLLERNADGRERARLVQIRLGVADDKETRVIQPQYVHVDDEGRRVVTPIRYRGEPDPNVSEITERKGKSRIWGDD